MSRIAKVVVWVIVILLVVIIGKMIFGGNDTNMGAGNVAPQYEKTSTGQAATNDSSDQALVKDMSNVDAEMNGLNSDSASADSAMSAK